MSTKTSIISFLECCDKENFAKISMLSKTASLKDYEHLTRITILTDTKIKIWSDALQIAINENEIVTIPAQDDKYYIDKTIIIPSNRRIIADRNAHISLTAQTNVLMFRNEHTQDGTHFPIKSGNEDCNISIDGGFWEEEKSYRLGYGNSGMYDENRSFFGVSTCMFFNNITGLTLTNMVFVQTAGFSVQTGNAKNIIFKNIHFENCFADGLHINGNTENLIIQNISGQVGDDIVALNMYDWQNSSVNWGPLKNALVENIELSPNSRYKAFRIQPGIYYYDNGSQVDCSISNVIIKNVKGINTFKLYYQTPMYKIGTTPEKGDTGSGDNIFLENIEINLYEPIDPLSEYLNSDPIRGIFAAFEIGANINNLSLSNINITLHREMYPLSYFLCIGPKSCIIENNIEVFDPYVSSQIKNLTLKNIIVNGKQITEPSEYIHITDFKNINSDGNSTAKGSINNISIIP